MSFDIVPFLLNSILFSLCFSWLFYLLTGWFSC